jgi:predicted enzyme related to lactoylglutathione lyase
MCVVNPLNIIIPINDISDYGMVVGYYEKVLEFVLEDDLLYLSIKAREVALRLMVVSPESKLECPPQRRFPIFCFKIKDNFLSYINDLHMRGATIEKVISDPGGYYSVISDPAGNQFCIECDNFIEENKNIDPILWPFYKRY